MAAGCLGVENLLASGSEEGPDLRCTSVMYATGGWTGMLRLTLFLVYPNLDTASLLNSKWSVVPCICNAPYITCYVTQKLSKIVKVI